MKFPVLATSGRLDSWKNIRGSREAAAVEETLGWSQGKWLMSATMYGGSISIVTWWQAKVFFLFCLFLKTLSFYSYKWCFNLENQNPAALLQSEWWWRWTPRCRFPPSLASQAQLACFTIDRPADEHALQGNFTLSWTSAGFENIKPLLERGKRPRLNIMVVVTDSTKKDKILKERKKNKESKTQKWSTSETVRQT